jgi:polysaccharide export outer membrane protein
MHLSIPAGFLNALLVRAAFVLALLAPAGVAAQETDPESVLRPGDLVRVTVFRKPELTAEMEVAGDGTLIHPLYRTIRAGGLTPEALEGQVRTFLLRYEAEPSFVIEPLVRVTALGEVRRPDVFIVRPNFTIFQLVAEAGGINDRGNTRAVTLVREGSERRLDLSRPGADDGQLTVRSGDVLVVPQRRSVFREVLLPAASLTGTAIAIINLLRDLGS